MNTNIMQYIISYTIIYHIYLELFIFKSPQYSSIIETLLSKSESKQNRFDHWHNGSRWKLPCRTSTIIKGY